MKNKTKNEVKTRQLTICGKYTPKKYGRGSTFPMVVLSGKWFEEIGFKPGHVIDVIYSNTGSVVLTLAKEQRFEHLK